MNTTHITLSKVLSGAAAVAVLGALVAGSAAPAAAASPGSPARAPDVGPAVRLDRSVLPVRGMIASLPDLGTLEATPAAGGNHCLFRVETTLELDGTVDGTATGVARATIHAPCDEATSNPPGTFADTFVYTGDFQGAVSGTEVSADVRYAGVTRVGGEVSALLILDGDVTVVAVVRTDVDDAGVFSGTYRGIATTPGARPDDTLQGIATTP